MNDLEMWNMLTGIVAPFVIALLVQSKWSDRTIALFGGLVIVAVALGTTYFQGELDGRSIASSIMIVFVTSATTHSHLWKPLGWYDTVKKKSDL